jgi:hypothetical protein
MGARASTGTLYILALLYYYYIIKNKHALYVVEGMGVSCLLCCA